MVASVTSPADLANIALARIGFKGRIGSLYEGSLAAKQILDVYAQTRDALLRSIDWGFAERNVNLALLKQAPAGGYFPPNAWNPAANPPIPWIFEYTYPADCLKVRAIKPAPLFTIDFDPQPQVFVIENDAAFTPPQRVILCNVPNAILTYSGQVTDPTTWESDFVEAFASALGRRIAPELTGMDVAKLEASDEADAKATAEAEEG